MNRQTEIRATFGLHTYVHQSPGQTQVVKWTKRIKQ